eukprot:5867939-Pleurochrysis_carterae.AAC.1
MSIILCGYYEGYGYSWGYGGAEVTDLAKELNEALLALSTATSHTHSIMLLIKESYFCKAIGQYMLFAAPCILDLVLLHVRRTA